MLLVFSISLSKKVPPEYKPVTIGYKKLKSRARLLRQHVLSSGYKAGHATRGGQIIISSVTEHAAVLGLGSSSTMLAVLVDADEDDNIHVVYVMGYGFSSIVASDILHNGFMAYVNLKHQGLIKPINWEDRIEKVKRLRTWHPLYGAYYVDKDNLEDVLRLISNADYARMLGLLKKQANGT